MMRTPRIHTRRDHPDFVDLDWSVPISEWTTDRLVQMPTGIPVSTVAVDGSANAAYLAASILSVADPDVAERLTAYREEFRA